MQMIIATVLNIVVLLCGCALPFALLVGWIRWVKSRTAGAPLALVSLVGFSLATLSALLAFGTVIYAGVIGGFPFQHPLLMRIFAWGGIWSVAGILCGLVGCWRRGPLRWYAPACAFGMFAFWVLAILAE